MRRTAVAGLALLLLVGIVPARFQVPISAPTARSMKMAPIAELTPPTAASLMAATV